MSKINALRATVLNSVEYLRNNPDKLEIWLDASLIDYDITTVGYSHKNLYTVKVLIQEYPGMPAELTVPILRFIKHHAEGNANPDISFDAELLDNDRVDVLYTLKLAEKVAVVDDGDGNIVITPPCDPVATLPWWTEPSGDYELWANDKLVGSWSTPE